MTITEIEKSDVCGKKGVYVASIMKVGSNHIPQFVAAKDVCKEICSMVKFAPHVNS